MTELVVYAASTIALALSALITRRATKAHDVAKEAQQLVDSLSPPSENGRRLPIVRVPCPQHDELVGSIDRNRRDLRALKRGQNEILDHMTSGNGEVTRRIHDDVGAEDTGRHEAQ